MASIPAIVDQFKRDPRTLIPERVIRAAAHDAGHRWRDRELGPIVTVQLMILQMLHANVSGRRLLRIVAMRVTDRAYFKARARLPIDVLGRVLFTLVHAARGHTPGSNRGNNFRGSLFRGHRVFTLDGSGVSMPDVPALRKAFGVPGRVADKLGFPVMHTLWMFDHATGLLIDFITAHGDRHDMADAHRFHPLLEPGDILLADRAFGSYAHIALLLQKSLHGVFRAHHRRIVKFAECKSGKAASSRRLQRLGKEDQIVEWLKPKNRPVWMSPEAYADLPATIIMRELRYRIVRAGFRTRCVTLATTLLDPQAYPKEELAELYGTRWTIETNLRHLKQTMGMGVLQCKSVEGVKKELLAYAIAYNLIRLRMLAAARRQGVDPDRISFIDAMDALCFGGDPQLRINPDRSAAGRHEPRVIKRPKDRYKYMTKPRDQLRQTLGITEVAA